MVDFAGPLQRAMEIAGWISSGNKDIPLGK